MDDRLASLLESLLLNVRVINGELERLYRSELLNNGPKTQRLFEQLREAYGHGMEVMQEAERAGKK